MRNAEATRERIMEAAMAEFSAYGIAGARVDRIAKTAGCNKNMIYIYFENKETLFSTLLERHLARVYEEIPLTLDDLPGFATRTFDFAMANPDLMRLMAWFALEQRPDQHHPTRSNSRDTNVAAIAKAQGAGKISKTFPASFLLTAVLSLCTAWTAANPFGPSLDPEGRKRQVALRRNIAEVVRLLTEPKKEVG